MPDSYDLSQLDPNTFEHLVNQITLRVLGPGSTGFGPGSDGGRDGYFEGEAPYPSETEHWFGCWYIQSKFHKPHLSKDPQKWLLEQIKEEIKEFKNPDSKRRWPDNWIIATNIDPSGVPETGGFDQARELVSQARPVLKNHFHIWGGRKILDFLALHSEITDYYRHFLTPGKILTEIYNQIKDAQAEVKPILRFLVLSQFDEQQYTKLEQAAPPGSTIEQPGIHDLFIDLPFRSKEHAFEALVMESLVCAAAKCHRFDEEQPDTEEWKLWCRHPSRARVWFIKGGPGQGKSTIGQYFCQIQRAALILQKDSLLPRSLGKNKNLAAAIQKVADKNDFWPVKPRIPISIELKEFAQWFGQRDRNISRGVLTYLAEWISIGVEQPLLVGTLKRMLESHSWVIVFDGLDEVPQDVKDAVASEVCRFVDNVALDSADILIICTSRPQGYSGQFADLDSSTIELISLSPDQALACAKPVLGLGRSPNQAKKHLQTLTSAIESPAVRELMTTPLQAHIMAVVVRDGERPPERKWKLFTNFYQVIKRREANRELPDKRLAKLLREQDQLLKTVHNRLGFVLHARAELSQGAQTKLDRDEFEKLVTGAVKQMVETEVDETIKVLMEATTDRLVLVSTPDDGNHVRFDIRPLQEFFAAEFLYESVSAEKLRQRIELIGGDAHWREVMHFLLSALVENNRQTELAVAAQVLDNFLNEGDEENLRLLRRRLGRGAILTARLLQEGVLDEDKRIRQQFRKSLEPLAGFTEIDLLRGLTQVSRADSQSWLYNFLISQLQDHNSTESIGAAIVLAQILPDEHGKAEEVRNFLLSSPSSYLSYVISSNPTRRDILLGRKSKFIRSWFLETILKAILSSKWSHLTENALSSGLEVLSAYQENVFNIAKKLAFSKLENDLLRILLNQDTHFERSDKYKVIKDYGSVEVFQGQLAWVSEFTELELSKEISEIPGVLQVCYLVVRFLKYQRHSELIEILRLFQSVDANLISIIFSQLKFHIPIDTKSSSSINAQIEKFSYISDKEIKELRFAHQEIKISDRYSRRQRLNPDLWQELVDDYPDLAIYLWSQDLVRQRENSKELLITIVEKVVKTPQVLQNHTSLWGHFIREAPEYESALRNAFMTASTGIINSQPPFSGFCVFKLNLPLEVSLLPYLVNALITSHRAYYYQVEDDRELDFLGKQIAEMVGDALYLREMIYDLSQPQLIRAAGVIAFLLHPNGSKELGCIKQLLVEFCNSQTGHWYLRAIANCLRLLATEEDPEARWIVNSLLEVTRADYEARQCLHGLLNLWRESSHSPIQKAGVLDKWLSGNE